MERTPEEMAWAIYLDRCVDNEALIQRFEAMTNNYRPIPPKTDDFDELWPWAEKNRLWLEAYRNWVTTRYGWQKAPQWLVEYATRKRG